MWKVCVALVGHRLLLVAVAFLVINANIPSTANNGLPQIHSTGTISSRFIGRLAEGPEFADLERLAQAPASQVFKLSRDPFQWVARWVLAILPFSATTVLLLISNIFLVLFLCELIALLSRMVTEDVAETAALLLVLWPTSWELGTGNSTSLVCYLVTLILRQAIDNRWLVGGIGIGLLTFMDPIAFGLLPYLLYLFWYFQRHFQWQQVAKRTAFFLIPFGLALYFRSETLPSWHEIWSGSALANVFAAAKGGGVGWTISRSFIGQTLTVLFFLVGAVFGALSNTGLMHRLLGPNLWILLLLFSPYSMVASRAPLAAVCLEGIATASSRATLRVIQTILGILSIYEIAVVFRYV